MFRFVKIENSDLISIKHLIIEIICGLLYFNQSEVPLSFTYYSYIIDTFVSLLSSKDERIINVIMKNSKYIFTLDFRGLLILIPIYLSHIKEILIVDSKFSDTTKNSAITILGSLIFVPDHYGKNYNIPLLLEEGKCIPMSQVKLSIYSIIMNIMITFHIDSKSSKKYIEIIKKTICCVTVLIYHETLKTDIEIDTIKVN